MLKCITCLCNYFITRKIQRLLLPQPPPGPKKRANLAQFMLWRRLKAFYEPIMGYGLGAPLFPCLAVLGVGFAEKPVMSVLISLENSKEISQRMILETQL